MVGTAISTATASLHTMPDDISLDPRATLSYGVNESSR
jgi:hypothetical protein